MTNIGRKLPAGLQDFEKIRTENYVYVDKTRYIHELTMNKAPYFLARPRRFGKSLFLSTLKQYFLGKKDLFEGLFISEIEKEWVEYPVFYIDFVKEGYISLEHLYSGLDTNLRILEEQWGSDEKEKTPAKRLSGLIRRAKEKTGRNVVILIDEYDRPLTHTLDDEELNQKMREVLKGFYGVIKGADADLHFVFITGVTKFAKVSVFSDMNNLIDISMYDKYSGICGITQAELESDFKPEIQAIANKHGLTHEETLARLKKRYDGYHFSRNGEDIYNTFSLLNIFSELEFGNYWFATGTPTFLVKMLKAQNYEIKNLENNVLVPSDAIYDYRADIHNPIPLLYQSGYLTIMSYDKMFDEYVLGFPNEEVKYGFYNELLPAYMEGQQCITDFYAPNFIRDLYADNVDGFMTRLRAFFANIPNNLNNKEEKHFQTVFFLIFTLMGQFIETEYNSAIGRADAIVVTPAAVYAFEFKISERATAEEAVRQIEEKGYLTPFASSGKRLVKVGVEFDNNKRGISRWVVG
jgi:hypothetical protein